jgi:hypothetical protein
MEPEPTQDKRLALEEDGLDRKQRDVYDSALIRLRKEQQKEGGARNVTVARRLEIIKGIKSGKISAPTPESNPIPGVDLQKVSRDYENRRPTFIENSLPTGDRD